MRDPDRIKALLSLLEELWLRDVDLRFNQLIYNLQYEFSASNNDIGKVKTIEPDGFEKVGFDLFNLEDEKFINFLKSKIAKAQ